MFIVYLDLFPPWEVALHLNNPEDQELTGLHVISEGLEFKKGWEESSWMLMD